MRDLIFGIIEQIRSEGGRGEATSDVGVRKAVDFLVNGAGNDREAFVAVVGEIRHKLLDLTLRLTDAANRERILAADDLWNGCMRDHFVADANHLIGEDQVRWLFKTVNETDATPESGFVIGLDNSINQDLRRFVYNQLVEELAEPSPDGYTDAYASEGN